RTLQLLPLFKELPLNLIQSVQVNLNAVPLYLCQHKAELIHEIKDRLKPNVIRLFILLQHLEIEGFGRNHVASAILLNNLDRHFLEAYALAPKIGNKLSLLQRQAIPDTQIFKGKLRLLPSVQDVSRDHRIKDRPIVGEA